MVDKPLIEQTYPVYAGDFLQAGEASGSIKKFLRQLGVDSGIVRRVAIAAYEAEMNIVIHSVGGQLMLRVSPEYIMLISEDNGPGIPDIELAMQEGYSTAPEEAREMGFGAGMGLSNMKRCADEFNIYSEVGKGTKLKIVIKL